MPTPNKIVEPNFIRTVIAAWNVDGAGTGLGPDFAANTALTVFGPFTPGFFCTVEKLRFIVGNANFAGAGGTLSFDLVKNAGGANPKTIATLTVALAGALRGVVLDAAVSAANDADARILPTDTLSIVRQATGTVFTSAQGDWAILARQPAQNKGA